MAVPKRRRKGSEAVHNPTLAATVENTVRQDSVESRLRGELAELKSKYRHALDRLDAATAEIEKSRAVSGIKARPIKPLKRRGPRAQATAVLVCSDWHVEETVLPDDCRGLNEYTLSIADRRITQLAEKSAMLIEHEKHLTDIRRICVLALGDMITGHIHEDLVERTALAPLSAIRWAGERLKGVIEHMAGIAPVLVATASGNHGRTTHKPRVATELEHSYEQHLYLTMASAEANANVQWQVGRGYHNVVDLDGFRLRCHHGHALKFGGGVGGLTIPTNKAIAAWNVAQRADLDVFGHWHQFLYVPYRFVANASLIGHNAYADRIRAEYQPPSQTLIVIDHNHNRVTKVLPIFVQ